MTIPTYDPKRTTLSITGVQGTHNISGFNDLEGSPFRPELGSEFYDLKTDSNGKSYRIKKIMSSTGTVRLNLAPTSPGNSILSNYMAIDTTIENNGDFDLVFTDYNTGSTISAKGFVNGITYMVEGIEWELALANIVHTVTVLI